MRFRWLDIEDEAEALGDLDVENFPTLLIGRAGFVLFTGPMLPQHKHLRRMIEQFPLRWMKAVTTRSPARRRRAWQENADLRRLCRG